MNQVTTNPNPTVTIPAVPTATVIRIDHDELLNLLILRAMKREGKGDVFQVDYKTDMLKKGKLRAAARTAFAKGIFHVVRVTCQVNYDYGKKLEKRTDGEETAKGGPTWQQAVEINGHLSPLTVHKDDVASVNPLRFIPNARVYLRYEPVTDNQKAAGFGKSDFSRYEDADGNEIAYETVQPYFFDREPQAVNHRTLSLGNTTRVKLDGIFYEVR